jgi:hypothetical protein
MTKRKSRLYVTVFHVEIHVFSCLASHERKAAADFPAVFHYFYAPDYSCF